ncbi:FAD-binding oxidoreductase [bacterium]|nr:FAD-binding oxidoreductase [bacterium]
MNRELFKQKCVGIPSTEQSETIALYAKDESRYPAGDVEMVLFPQTAEDVSTIMKASLLAEMPITTGAARTGISGASVPQSGTIMSLEKVTFPPAAHLDGDTLYITASPSISLAEIDRILATPSLCHDGESEPLKKLHAQKNGWIYPVDPTEMSASLGGSVATNASGARSLKYGATREWIRGLTVVLPNGEIVTLKRGECKAKNLTLTLNTKSGKPATIPLPAYTMPQTKNAAGIYAKPDMDAVDLFIGSEGILATIVSLDINIIPRITSFSALLFTLDDETAISLVPIMKKMFETRLEFLEFADENAVDLIRRTSENDTKVQQLGTPFKDAGALLFFDIKIDEMQSKETAETLNKINILLNNSDTNPSHCLIGWSDENRELIRYMRHLVPERVNEAVAINKRSYPELHKVGTDFAVPDSDFGELYNYSRALLIESDIPFVVFGHIGQSHLHFNMLPQTPEQMKIAKECYYRMAQKSVSLGGTISAEHGVGKIKRDYLEILYKKEGVEMMRKTKKSLDPHFLLNRGTMFREK